MKQLRVRDRIIQADEIYIRQIGFNSLLSFKWYWIKLTIIEKTSTSTVQCDHTFDITKEQFEEYEKKLGAATE